MAEYKREIGVAAMAAVLAAIGIGIFAINAFPSGGLTSTQLVVTQSKVTTTGGAVATTSTQVQSVVTQQTASTSREAVTTSTQTNYADIATTTYTGAVATTETSTQFACNNGQGQSETGCLYFLGWGINYTSSALFISVWNSGQDTIALNITYSGSQTNKGFTGSVNLDSLNLPASKYDQTVTSPPLPNLQLGDQVTVTVTGTAGIYFTTSFTETAGPQH